MKTEKFMLDGKEIDVVVKLDEDDYEVPLYEKDNLEDTIDLSKIIEKDEYTKEENINE